MVEDYLELIVVRLAVDASVVGLFGLFVIGIHLQAIQQADLSRVDLGPVADNSFSGTGLDVLDACIV